MEKDKTMNNNEITGRELSEIKLAIFYEEKLYHGTDGHSRLMLIAKLAKAHGFYLKWDGDINVPEYWVVKG